MVMRSPNDIMDAAREYVGCGERCASVEDAVRAINFIAANIHHEVAAAATWLVVQLFEELQHEGVTKEFVAEVAAFQHRGSN